MSLTMIVRSTLRGFLLTALASLAALIAILALPVEPGYSAVIHRYLAQVTEVPANSGASFTGPLQGALSMTIDEGDLWMIERQEGDNGHIAIDEFNDSSGAFVKQWPQTPSSEPEHLAIGHATGETEMYTTGRREQGVEVLDSSGALQATWTGADTPNEAFAGTYGTIEDVAVDDNTDTSFDSAAGDVYLATATKFSQLYSEYKVVDVFKPEVGGGEKYITQLTGPSPGEAFHDPAAIAVNSSTGEVIVANDGESGTGEGAEVDRFMPVLGAPGSYEFVGKLAGLPPGGNFEGFVRGLGVDGNTGGIYVALKNSNYVYEFNADGDYVGRTSLGEAPGGSSATEALSVTADPTSHDVFVGSADYATGVFPVDVFGPAITVPDVETEAASDITPTTVTLHGTLNPDSAGAASCQFVWGTTEDFGETTECEAPVADGGSSTPVSAVLKGLLPDTVYHFRLQGSNAGGSNPGEVWQDQEVRTSGAGIHSASALDVSSESATLEAAIDPNGEPTTYYFEYRPTAAYGGFAPAAPGASLGAGMGDVSVSQHVQGLDAASAYHYRVVAVSELSPGTFQQFYGPDESLTTQAPGAPLQLLDGRQWELVSPPNKRGARIAGLSTDGVFRASPDGKAITYVATSPTEAEPAGYDAEVQILSRRTGAGWSSKDISPPNTQAGGLEVDPTYQFASEDLSNYLVYPFSGSTTPLLSPFASAPTPYLRSQTACEVEGEGADGGCYLPLATTQGPAADLPPGTEFDLSASDRMRFEGATPEMRHVFLNYQRALTETPTNGNDELYEWSPERSGSDALKLISVMPEAEGGGASMASYVSIGGNPGARWSAARNAISDHANRVFWAAQIEGGTGLYLRDVARAGGTGETIRLDMRQPGAPSGTPEALFQFASRDGSRVFFRDKEPLTASSGAGGRTSAGAGDLYECQIVEEEGKEACKLTDLTPINNAGEQAEVMNILPGAAEDGSYVYFVANGVLAEGASRGDCEEFGPKTGTCNLYVYHDGNTKFIATLGVADAGDWGGLDEVFHNLGRLTAEASPDGRYLAFMSAQKLTGYDNRDEATNEPAEEVYLYDALSEGVVCASCEPTGARPTGMTVEEFAGTVGANPNLAAVPSDTEESETVLAANLPRGDSLGQYGESLYQARYVMNDGRLVFNSVSPLVPQDINGAVDVYEYEPAGIGSCERVSLTYADSAAGCVDLVSAGTAAEESGFLEASEDDDDIFFITGGQLSRSDRDTALDVYDARACSQAEPCPEELAASPACTSADACREAPSPQPSVFGAPPTATFNGAGNFTAKRLTAVKKAGRKGTRGRQRLRKALKVCAHRRTRAKRRQCSRRARARYGRDRDGARHHRSAQPGR